MTYKYLAVSDETFSMMMHECKALFLKKNPDFDGIYLTQEFMVRRVCKSYLEKL